MTSTVHRDQQSEVTADAAVLRIGAICLIVGAVAFGTLRMLHGDTPGNDPAGSLSFVAGRAIYAGVHIGAVLAALLSLAGATALVGSLTRPAARLLGRWGLVSSLVGLGIFGVESTSEGLALPELAKASATASPEQRAELIRAAHAVLAVTHGPSLVAVAVLYGTSLIGLGIAVVLDEYPSWLGWVGLAVGVAILLAASGQYLNPDLMPGFVIYGLLASILVQAWLIAVAAVMLRRVASMPSAAS